MAATIVTYWGWIILASLVRAIAGIGSASSLLHASRAAISPLSPNPWLTTRMLALLSISVWISASSVSLVVNQALLSFSFADPCTTHACEWALS
eukprot:5573187-Prymnesium_polylepis.1